MNEHQRNPFLNSRTFGVSGGLEPPLALFIADIENKRFPEKDTSVQEKSGKWTFHFPRRLWRRRQSNRVSA